MSQVRFYAMSLDFEKVKSDYANTDFEGYILQPFMDNANKNRDEYFLLAYPVVKGKIGSMFKLTPEKQNHYQAKDILYLGNLYFGRKKISNFINEPGVKDLFFDPTQYPKPHGDYVGYIVKSRPGGTVVVLTEEELNPSPPATPGFD